MIMWASVSARRGQLGAPIRDNDAVDLPAALAAYDKVALNLDKLDRVWQRMQAMLPSGPFIGTASPDAVAYAELGEAWTTIAASLPAIDGWRIEAEIMDYADIGQIRLDYMDIDEPGGLMGFEARLEAPGTEALKYRHKLARARQLLVRQRSGELVSRVDELLVPVPTEPDRELPEDEVAPVIAALKEAVNELERLLGEALAGGPRQSDLHRHLHYAEPHDLRDIAVFDWPAFRPHVELAIYGEDTPVPVGVDDLASLASTAASPVPSQVQWDRLDADGFEKLLTRVLEQAGSYIRITRLMNVNAADAGRDIEAYQVVSDGLLSEDHLRVIVQAKHWPARGVGASEIAELVHSKLPLWEGEPVRVLIVATTGSFTQDAVRWVDDHNRAAKRPNIVLWSSSELEAILRKWPAVLAEFGLVD